MADGELIPLDNIRTAEERAYKAYQKRLSGESWNSIAVTMQYKNPAAAKREVDNFITKATRIASDELKREVVELELDRLDALQNSVWGMAVTGDLKAVETTLKIMQHRARLLQLGEESKGNTIQTVIVAGEDYVETLRSMAK